MKHCKVKASRLYRRECKRLRIDKRKLLNELRKAHAKLRYRQVSMDLRAVSLCGAIIWAHTPQGHSFWRAIDGARV